MNHTGYAIALYIAACSVVTLFAASAMRDHTGEEVGVGYEPKGIPVPV